MDFRQLNALLKNLESLRNGKNLLERDIVHKIEDEGNQGDEGVSFEVYQIPGHNLHVRLRITTDSYGDNEKIAGIEFVQPIEKTITRFESI
jgi:hypothetical protein